MASQTRHITLPAGFRAAGVKCGIKASGREDLALLVADKTAAAAVVTTQNQVVGAPVIWCRKILPRGYGRLRAFVINSGCANVCTGRGGLADARTMAAETARLIGAEPESVLVASTGIIGHRLPMAKIRRGIAAAARSLGTANDAAMVHAMMTTDTREKSAVVQTHIARRPVIVAGVVKGSGMIAPSMATMLGAITTDVAISPRVLARALRAAVGSSFNAITVDSDTSTSDTVAVLASGVAGGAPLDADTPAYRKFAAVLAEVCGELARAVVADGEGATKVIEVAVSGARSDAEAKAAAMTVANSPLLKCAVHGGDPNWGRVVAALGRSPAKVDPRKLSVKIGPETVFARGMERKFNLQRAESHLAQPTVTIACDLHLGRGRFTALTCDLSHEYVTINADYHT